MLMYYVKYALMLLWQIFSHWGKISRVMARRAKFKTQIIQNILVIIHFPRKIV